MVVALLSEDDSSASEDLLLDASAAREERLRMKRLQDSRKPLLLRQVLFLTTQMNAAAIL